MVRLRVWPPSCRSWQTGIRRRARPVAVCPRQSLHPENGRMLPGILLAPENSVGRTFVERDRMNPDHNLTPRPVRDSQSEMNEIVLPNDANPLNALLGGRLMHWIDLAGALAAHRHSRQWVVTASIDHLDFLVPVRVGDFVILRSSVNRVYHTSMEVGVKVWVENYRAEESR